MMKRIIAAAGAGAMVLAASATVFAYGQYPWWGWGSRDVAVVENVAVADSVTGGNSQDVTAWSCGYIDDANGTRSIRTGNANAYAGAVTIANTHVGCDQCGWGWGSHNDYANVGNYAQSYGLSGGNTQDVTAWRGGRVNDADGSRAVSTGNANTESHAWTVVNTHWNY
jgi:hypothetical protein